MSAVCRDDGPVDPIVIGISGDCTHGSGGEAEARRQSSGLLEPLVAQPLSMPLQEAGQPVPAARVKHAFGRVGLALPVSVAGPVELPGGGCVGVSVEKPIESGDRFRRHSADLRHGPRQVHGVQGQRLSATHAEFDRRLVAVASGGGVFDEKPEQPFAIGVGRSDAVHTRSKSQVSARMRSA